jgi:hypothetical protein
MNPIAAVFLLVSALAILLLPRRWAPLPLMVGACYITRAQGLDLGPFSFTVVRILVVFGVLRVVVRREWLAGGLNRLDGLMVVWGILMVVTGLFHKDAIVNRLGLAFDGWGLYFLFRIFCRSADELFSLCRLTAMLLVPIAVEMVIEKVTAHNFFSVLGGVSASPAIRDGRIRAQGPFGHSILAGNIGAVTLPLMIGVWKMHRGTALIGIAACLAMVFASSSSGPIMSTGVAIFAMFCWRYRYQTRALQWAAILTYIGLEIVMEDPAYYIMARIDLAGGSTGWHRARLIDSAFSHLSEWWFAGTDYTRHWMPSGVAWSRDHTDITNHYLRMGVLGGLPLMVSFILVLMKGFSFVGRGLRQPDMPPQSQFLLWACGASLFAHTATCISVSYFDQSIVFLYLSLAATVGASYAGAVAATAPSPAAATARVIARPPVPARHASRSVSQPGPGSKPSRIVREVRRPASAAPQARESKGGRSESRRA